MVNSEKEQKIEEIVMYGYEEILYRYFRLFQNPTKYGMKKINDFQQYCFLSERFYTIYQIISHKYPELELPKKVYHQGEIFPKGSTLYINDAVAELPTKIKRNDRMLFVAPVSFLQTNQEYIHINYDNDLKKEIIIAPWASDEKEKNISKNILKKSSAIIYSETLRRKLNFLGYELQYLKNNSEKNVYDSAPIGIKEYMKTIFENKEQIKYFLETFYQLNRRSKTDFEDENDRELLEFQKEAAEQTKKHFKENLNAEILTFFQTIMPAFLNFFHYPIFYEFNELKIRLRLLSGDIYNELANPHFSGKKLEEGIKLEEEMILSRRH